MPEAAVLPEELEQPDRVSTPAAAITLIREIKVLRFIVGFPFLYKNICEINSFRHSQRCASSLKEGALSKEGDFLVLPKAPSRRGLSAKQTGGVG